MSVVTYSGERVFFIFPVLQKERASAPPGAVSSLQQPGQDLGVSIPFRPALRSNAWIREPRLRSEPISERISSTIGMGAGGTLRSCTLRASLADTTTGPAGTNPLSAAGDLPILSVCSCRRSIRRLGGTTRTCGSGAGGGGGGSGHCSNWRRSCDGSRCFGRLLAGLPGYFCLYLRRRNTLEVAKRSCKNIPGAQEEVNFSIKLSDDFCTCHAESFYRSPQSSAEQLSCGIDCWLLPVRNGSQLCVIGRAQSGREKPRCPCAALRWTQPAPGFL